MRFQTLLLAAFTFTTTIIYSQTPCEDGMAGIYPCNEVDLMSQVSLEDMNGVQNMNDIWGWTDEESGREFALVGLRNGTSFVEVTDPVNPVIIGFLETSSGNSLWRDIKVFSDHAFIVSESNFHGIQVLDLSRLLEDYEELPVVFESDAHYDLFGRAHNIVMNEESGFAYGVGTSTYAGGLHFVDVNDPLNPQVAGGYDGDGYTHDAQVVIYDGPDGDYLGREIAFACNEDAVTIIDVTDKEDPVLISSTPYDDSAYTHQGWLTDDGKYFIFNDELDELDQLTTLTKTYFLDVTDLDEPFIHYEHLGETTAIDHNLYNRGSLCYQSDYRAGLRIIDVGNVQEEDISELAFFDSQPDDDQASFSGTWSNYAYFPSGTVIMTDMYSDLFVLRPTLINAYRYAEVCGNAQSVDYYIDVTWSEEITNAVAINVPANMEVYFGNIVAPGKIPVTVNFTDVIDEGEYNISVALLNEGESIFQQALRVIVDNGDPIVLTGLSPENDYESDSNIVTLSWDLIDGIDEYTLTIASESDFSDIVVQEVVEGNTYEFEGQGAFYWTVTAASSPCGIEFESDVMNFSNFYFGIEELTTTFEIFPNPAADKLTVSNFTGSIGLHSMDGKLIESYYINQMGELDISNISPGVYLLKETEGLGQVKLVKE